MAVFAFHPTKDIDRRADGVGFVLAEGADEASARAAAQALIGGQSIEGFAAVEVGAGVPAVAVQGLPVGGPDQGTWPKLTRGGGFLNPEA
jgi:hypothetical protein